MDLIPQGAMQPMIKTMDIDTDIPIATIAFYSEKMKIWFLKQNFFFNEK